MFVSLDSLAKPLLTDAAIYPTSEPIDFFISSGSTVLQYKPFLKCIFLLVVSAGVSGWWVVY